MKLNQKLIEQLRNGEIAVGNSGTVEQLREVLKAAFPEDAWYTYVSCSYYYLSKVHASRWTGGTKTNLPIKEISYFYQPELFTGWAKDDKFPNWMAYFVDDVARYWIDGKKWNTLPNGYRYSSDCDNRPATHEEVISKLISHAASAGYKKGVKIKYKKSVLKILSDNFIVTDSFEVVVFTDIGCYELFKDGEWAEIVTEERTYKPGDRLEILDNNYIICNVKDNNILLLNPKTGKRWYSEFSVHNIDKITKKELDDHIECEWTLIENKQP